jgi:hypothetical protein
MKGKKERQRKQQEQIKQQAIKNAWAPGPFTGTIPTRTDMQVAAYKVGAEAWANKGNRLVDVMQGVRVLLCEIENPLVKQARNILLEAIKEYDTLL